MPFNIDNLALYLVDALRDSNPPKLPKFGQNQSAPDTTQQQPVTNQAPMSVPALPQSLERMTNQGGGGIGQTLGNMGKSFLGTMGEALPPALANYALFGNTPMGQMMTRASLMNQLEEKKRVRKVKKQNMTADFTSYIWKIQKDWKDKGVDVDVMTAFFSEQPTGYPELDKQLQPGREAIMPLFKDGLLDSGDMLQSMKSFAEYNKLLEGEKTKYQAVSGSEGQMVDPEHPEKGVINIPGFQPKSDLMSSDELAQYRVKAGITADEKAKRRAPPKPPKPLAKKRVMMTSSDGTMEVEGIFDPNTERTTPVQVYDAKTKTWKPKPWRKKKVKGSGSPKNAQEFMEIYGK